MTHSWRSLLFVPGDSDRKIEKSRQSTADVIIFDLEDAVVPDARPQARQRVTDALRDSENGRVRGVRINPPDSKDALEDLQAVMAGRPDYIMVPKVSRADELDMLANRIDALERTLKTPSMPTKIIALMTETPQMTLNLPTVTTLHERVAALTWGGEDLATALGAIDNKNEQGQWTSTFQLARSLCLLAARACNIVALDTLYSNFRDVDGMRAHAATARRDGFDGVMAIHPDQVDVINTAFTPTDDEVTHARAVVSAFANAPGVGVLELGGKMLDRPHLALAEKVLRAAGVSDKT